ncbi:Golgi transport complex subunit 7 [Kappamyces sp. JEL0829]|nr:Golgi transport complex subunit 7 [Kappamyces sp. JEL0829]
MQEIFTKLTAEMLKIRKKMASQSSEMSSFKGTVVDALHSVHDQQARKSKSLQCLESLTRAADRIKAVQICMKDSDNWGTVVAEMDAFFAASDHTKAFQRIKEAEKSLELLITKNAVKDIDQRKGLVDSLKGRLGTMLANDIMNALAETRLDDTRLLCDYLDALGQATTSKTIILDWKRPSIMQLWPSQALLPPPPKICGSLQAFFDNLWEILNAIAPVFAALYENPNQEMHIWLSTVFSSLVPSVAELLGQVEQSGNKTFIEHLTGLYGISTAFGDRLERDFPSQLQARVLDQQDWGSTLFESFLPFQKKFDVYESHYLEYSVESVGTLDEVLAMANGSVSRFFALTAGIATFDMLCLLDVFILKGIEKLHRMSLASKPAITQQSLAAMSHTNPRFNATMKELQDLIQFVKKLEAFWAETKSRTSSSVKVSGKSQERALSKLRREIKIGGPPVPLHSTDKVTDLIVACQARVLETLVNPIDELLETIPGLPNWTATSETISFGPSPLSYITSIGEYMLTLPQYFDPFAQDETLSFSLKTLPFVAEMNHELESQTEEEPAYDPNHLWIIASVRLIEERYASKILLIPRLSPHGLQQLLTDMTYLQNVMAAVDIDPQEKLREIIQTLGLSESELRDNAENNASVIYNRIRDMRFQ